MNKAHAKRQNDEGSALVLVMLVLLVLSVLSASLGVVTIGSHRLGNENLKVNSAYYIAEAGANIAYGELENEISSIYTDSSSVSPATFFSNIDKFIYTDNRLHNTSYENFTLQNGENPKAQIKIIKIEESGTTKEYIIESKGIVGNNSRIVGKRVLLRWFDKDTEDSEHLPFPIPPLGTAITFSEKIDFSGTDTQVVGDITHTGSGTMNIEDRWASEHDGHFVTDTSIDLSEYTVDLSSFNPEVLKPNINLAQYNVPEISVFPEVPSITNQVFESNGTDIVLHENTYISNIERKWNENLDIYIPNQEIYLVVDRFVLRGSNKINVIGNGKLNLVVRNTLDTGYDLKINQGNSVGNLEFIYSGMNNLAFPGGFKYTGNIYSLNSGITLPSSSVVNGGVLSKAQITTGTTSEISGDVYSLTGNINIGYKNTIKGSLLSESGSIEVGNESDIIGSIETQNGSITVGEGTNISGRVVTDYGNIYTKKSAKVSGDVVTKNGNISVGFQNKLLGSVFSGTGNIDIGGELTIPGDVVTNKGYIKVAANSNINGKMISGEGDIELGYNNNVYKGISTSLGDIKVAYGSNITGNILTNNGNIKFVGASKITGNIHTGLGNISIGYDSSGSKKPTVDGNIITNNGQISIGGASLVNGAVISDGGNLTIDGQTILNGIAFSNGYDMTIGWNTTVNGALLAGEGDTTFNGESKVTGTIISKKIKFGYRERIKYSEDYLADFSFKPNTGDDSGKDINIGDLITTKPATEN